MWRTLMIYRGKCRLLIVLLFFVGIGVGFCDDPQYGVSLEVNEWNSSEEKGFFLSALLVSLDDFDIAAWENGGGPQGIIGLPVKAEVEPHAECYLVHVSGFGPGEQPLFEFTEEFFIDTPFLFGWIISERLYDMYAEHGYDI